MHVHINTIITDAHVHRRTPRVPVCMYACMHMCINTIITDAHVHRRPPRVPKRFVKGPQARRNASGSDHTRRQTGQQCSAHGRERWFSDMCPGKDMYVWLCVCREARWWFSVYNAVLWLGITCKTSYSLARIIDRMIFCLCGPYATPICFCMQAITRLVYTCWRNTVFWGPYVYLMYTII
jgi:hypothetical protein